MSLTWISVYFMFHLLFVLCMIFTLQSILHCLLIPFFSPPVFPLPSPDHQPLWLLDVLLRHHSHQAAALNNVSYAVNRQTPLHVPAGNLVLHHSHTLLMVCNKQQQICKLQMTYIFTSQRYSMYMHT